MDEFGDRLQAALPGAYRIERELGGGGMARVFVAEDLTLGRRVALKVLPPETADVIDVDRFKREIQLAARLQQPFIVPLLSAGTSGGLLYYTMPLVEGESLHTRLARMNQLSIDDTVRILRDVLAALSYAHKHGVVHRDVKPANVLLADEHALITDFGIAKALGTATASGPLTASGLAIGTPAYMAPEQAAGDGAIDHRADLYAVGVMAYEMLAGVPPFPGATAALVMARQIREPAEPVTHHRPQVPAKLAELVGRLLHKNPADRPQSADEVLRTLEQVAVTPGDSPGTPISNGAAPVGDISPLRRWWVPIGVLVSVFVLWLGSYEWRQRAPIENPSAPGTAVAASASLSSLAILPFVNESPDTTLAYFADGMTDELIRALSGLSGLTVMSRSSVFPLKGKGLDPSRLGDTLHVAFLLEGAVRRAGDRVRITATLLSARDGTTRWSGTFGGDLKDVFGVQDSIARTVMDSLRVRIGAGGLQRVVSRPTTIPEAYDLYLRALELFNDRTELETSVALVQMALRRDSLFAAAHALLANNYIVMANDQRREDLWPFARLQALRAIQLDSTCAEGHAALASILMVVDRDWTQSAHHFERAIALAPSYEAAHDWRALLLAFRGQGAEAVLENNRARRVNPLSAIVVVHGGWIRILQRELDSAATLMRLGIAMSHGRDDFTIDQLADVYTLQRRFSESIAQRHQALALRGADTLDQIGLAWTLARGGQLAEARRIAESMSEPAKRGVLPKRDLATLAIALGDTAAALDWLSRAADEHTLAVLDIGASPMFDGLHGQPEFKRILGKLGLRPSQ